MENTDILICGAGIAGPALAHWLRRHGFRPTVVERVPGPRPGGQAVDLRGAGRTVIERMGLMERARALCVAPVQVPQGHPASDPLHRERPLEDHTRR